ncbi:ATP-binding protein [Streptomyces fulvorobeus]|uniref:Anti-sigma regulatory factor (Ser/Thr protein kinase) n=1 Tax=Streptomyces fulvorobeus TaxID=284028 RepID=A0A7J0CGW1_9ACTN|nr:ATP-binding protein [Streptomyces fulvorobeus]NYE44417.1 anti-sigma regulatory factor (Ser/Thr protein kinase) [Streptomyces fulvorobeus]GFN00947.1 hypothetical protein Sfulv_57570 [Streptomyces fulvorobeus]
MQPQSEAQARTSTHRRFSGRCAENGRTVRTCTQARECVRRMLAGARGVEESRINDLLLVVSELATNAQRHAGGITDFSLDVDRGSATVSVTDASSDVPSYRCRKELTIGGFGWGIVLRLCREVAVSVHPGGKTIRAVVAL